MSTNKFLLSAISFLAISTAANAGEVSVINENMKKLDIKIEAEGDSKATFDHMIPADRESKFTVSQDQLNGKTYFSVKGSTNAFTPGSKCDHLHVDKSYQLTFQDDKVGTTCVSTEMTDDMMKSTDSKMMDEKAGKM